MGNESNKRKNVSEVSLIYKLKVKASERPTIHSSRDAFDLFLQHWNMGTIEMVEEFKVMMLNRSNKVLTIYDVSRGGITSTVADPRIIYAVALKTLAVNMIICHNHPSGNLQPSRADEELISKIASAGKYFDIKVIDALIISSETYYSFSDEGII